MKTRFPFLYASTSLDRNFDSCLSIRCLAPQQILRFFFSFLPQVLPLPSATVLIIASSSSMLHLAIEIKKKKKKKKEGVADGLRFLGNLYILLYHCFAVSGGEIISWRDASCLRTFMSLNLAFYFGRNTTRTIL